MWKVEYKTSTVVLTDNEFNKVTKKYEKKAIKLAYYDFDGLSLKMYDKQDGTKIGELSIDGVGNFTLWENEWDYGKYWSGTVEKGQLYFNVKKGLARRGETAPLTLTFREAVLDSDAKDLADVEQAKADDSDLPF